MSRCSVTRTSWVLGILFVILVGCSHSPPTKYYDLGPLTEKEVREPSEACVSIAIGPVKIPEYLNRSGIVTRLSSNELGVAEFSKWAEPLEENFPRVLAENLSSLLCTKTVLIFPWKGSIPLDYWVYVYVTRMDGKLGESAVLDVSWTIMGSTEKRGTPLMKRASYQEPARRLDYEDFVAGQSRNLAALSRDIADAIKALPQ